MVAALALPVHAETVIAALGDSLTQGYGLPQEQGFVPRLEAWLREHGADARVLNAGVSGDTSAGGRARVDWTLAGGADAMIVELGANDALRGVAPAETRANLAAILTAAETAGVPVLLVGVPALGNYGPDYRAEFDAIWPSLAVEHGALLAPDFFAGLGGDAAAARAAWMQPDGLHPNAEGVERIVAALGPLVLDLIARTGD